MALAIALADESLLVRAGVSQILTAQPDLDVVARCRDLPSLLEAIDRALPDVVVTGIRMPPTHTDEGIRLAAHLRERHPEIGVVILSNYAEPAYTLAFLEAGSRGRAYLLKQRIRDPAQLVEAIRAVAAGGSIVDSKIVESLIVSKLGKERSRLSELTPREKEVLAEIAKGKSNAAVADALLLTKRAVEKHISSIFVKLDLAIANDVSKRVKATLLFLADSASSRKA
jgi:DNA-binding NarL/FixJ family response regulator